MRKLISMLAITTVLFPAFARKETGSLEGTAVEQDGRPVQAAAVHINQTSDESNSHLRHFIVRTDRHGHFIYTGLPVGTYSVNIVSPDGRSLKQIPEVCVEGRVKSFV